jgi:uncharacterized metal-binding protein YceD (DUF177 family)
MMKQIVKSLEFSRPLEVARVPNLGSHEKIEADAAECAALAKRLNVPLIHSLRATLHAKSWRGGGMKVKGTVTVDLDQESVVSLEAFRSLLTFEVERYFLATAPHGDDESDMDIDVIEQGTIDLGEIAAETIALELDPYPRKPGESFEPIIEDDSPVEDEKPNPFKVLSLKT